MSGRATASISDDSAPLTSGDPVIRLAGIGPKRAEALARLGIATIGDLVRHFPRRYEDRRVITPIAGLVEGERVTVSVRVVGTRLVRLRGRLTMAEATIEDGTGQIRATWFNQGYLARSLKPGTALVLTGVVGKYKGLALKNPEMEILSGDELDSLHVGRLVPMYPLTEGLSHRVMREWIWSALEAGCIEPDLLPIATSAHFQFSDSAQAVRTVHFPDSIEQAETARRRFAFEELFVLQSLVVRQRAETSATTGIRHDIAGPLLAAFRGRLPFRPTRDQSAAIEDILNGMAAAAPMARLLQGDVGCGKTLVALHAIAACVDGGHQAALMAPTEVLAAQHYRTLIESLEPLGIRVALLTAASAKDVRGDVASGDAQVVVGTHALFERATEFRRLGLAIVDEQHRFGVGQRERLAAKGAYPDRLHMTATPIPRSLAMTLYGAMDLSIIRELPPGRVPVKTTAVTAKRRGETLSFARGQIEAGFQVYVVCPHVESNEKRALADAESKFRDLSEGAFGGLRCGLVHGRMPSEEKDALLEAFRAGGLDVLVSTTVIEVGVDAPRATVMMIEDAGNFGLTQLHQLRGRVGRGGQPSYCFLMGKPATDEAARRLEILCATHNGFEIAEEDFALRGPGETHGERQSGVTDLRAARLPRDTDLLLDARREAEAVFARDCALREPGHANLARAVDRLARITI